MCSPLIIISVKRQLKMQLNKLFTSSHLQNLAEIITVYGIKSGICVLRYLSCYFNRSIIVKLFETVSQILWFYYLCVRLCGPNVWIYFIKIASTVIHIFKKIYVRRLSHFCKPITSNEIWQRTTQFHNFFAKRFCNLFLTILYRVFY